MSVIWCSFSNCSDLYRSSGFVVHNLHSFSARACASNNPTPGLIELEQSSAAWTPRKSQGWNAVKNHKAVSTPIGARLFEIDDRTSPDQPCSALTASKLLMFRSATEASSNSMKSPRPLPHRCSNDGVPVLGDLFNYANRDSSTTYEGRPAFTSRSVIKHCVHSERG